MHCFPLSGVSDQPVLLYATLHDWLLSDLSLVPGISLCAIPATVPFLVASIEFKL